MNATIRADSEHGVVCSHKPSQLPLLLLQIQHLGMEWLCKREECVHSGGVLGNWLDQGAELGLPTAPPVLLGPTIVGGKKWLP